MVPRLELEDEELARVVKILRAYLKDESKIVQVSAMQALVDLVEQDEHFLKEVVEIIEKKTLGGSPAVQSRGRKLMAELKKRDSGR